MRSDDRIKEKVEKRFKNLPDSSSMKFAEARKWKSSETDGLKGLKKSSKLDIENDNVLRHEKPILVELGKPSRDKYD